METSVKNDLYYKDFSMVIGYINPSPVFESEVVILSFVLDFHFSCLNIFQELIDLGQDCWI